MSASRRPHPAEQAFFLEDIQVTPDRFPVPVGFARQLIVGDPVVAPEHAVLVGAEDLRPVRIPVHPVDQQDALVEGRIGDLGSHLPQDPAVGIQDDAFRCPGHRQHEVLRQLVVLDRVVGGAGGGADQIARFIQSVVEKKDLTPRPLVPNNKGGGSGAEALIAGILELQEMIQRGETQYDRLNS